MTLTASLSHALEFLSPIVESWEFNKIPLTLSVSGPQGSGKTWLSSHLTDQLSLKYPHLKTITISTDDFYERRSHQLKLNKNSDNVLLHGRGLPGTHDVDLLYNILQRLINQDTNFKIPVYDKSLFGGEGDRADQSLWTQIGDKPVDIIIVEGWFNGFIPLSNDDEIDAMIDSSDYLKLYKKDDLYEINHLLDEYLKIWELFDYGITIDVPDLKWIEQWRIEQEHALIASKHEGMTDDQVSKFIKRYLTVYELYYAHFVQVGIPNHRKIKNIKLKGIMRNLKLTLDQERNVTEVKAYKCSDD
ncbi:hypothetical protein WICPIJ_004915 [Wickerhamomyces pijperi]|uniref:Phosphoribulokinase/uridine kinase domain-containing protein n=1 Tax=Wickerhamomyces pijperi TaxID=599730 RepID=A0A9P8Q777_WICPI|nr:hypothetical protein WICPIJ_004915 [Wickerhamomyces pijperi]